MSDYLTYEQWARRPGVYADYGDYKKAVDFTREYHARLRREKENRDLEERIRRAVHSRSS